MSDRERPYSPDFSDSPRNCWSPPPTLNPLTYPPLPVVRSHSEEYFAPQARNPAQSASLLESRASEEHHLDLPDYFHGHPADLASDLAQGTSRESAMAYNQPQHLHLSELGSALNDTSQDSSFSFQSTAAPSEDDYFSEDGDNSIEPSIIQKTTNTNTNSNAAGPSHHPSGLVAPVGLLVQELHGDGRPRRGSARSKDTAAKAADSRHRRPDMQRTEPGMKTGEMSKKLALEWKNLPPAKKQFYNDRLFPYITKTILNNTEAKLLKDIFHKRFPNYVYRRKPNGGSRKRTNVNGLSSSSSSRGSSDTSSRGSGSSVGSAGSPTSVSSRGGDFQLPSPSDTSFRFHQQPRAYSTGSLPFRQDSPDFRKGSAGNNGSPQLWQGMPSSPLKYRPAIGNMRPPESPTGERHSSWSYPVTASSNRPQEAMSTAQSSSGSSGPRQFYDNQTRQRPLYENDNNPSAYAASYPQQLNTYPGFQSQSAPFQANRTATNRPSTSYHNTSQIYTPEMRDRSLPSPTYSRFPQPGSHANAALRSFRTSNVVLPNPSTGQIHNILQGPATLSSRGPAVLHHPAPVRFDASRTPGFAQRPSSITPPPQQVRSNQH